MSVTVTKGDGVTVFTMTSDSKSLLPPLCQILKNLCYSPVCCSVSQHLRSIQRNAQSVLGVSFSSAPLFPNQNRVTAVVLFRGWSLTL